MDPEMADYRLVILCAVLVASLLFARSDGDKRAQPVLYSYTLSDRAVCLYPHNSCLPGFYTQYHNNDYSHQDYGCGNNFQ